MKEQKFASTLAKLVVEAAEPLIGKGVNKHGELVPAIRCMTRKLRDVDPISLELDHLLLLPQDKGTSVSVMIQLRTLDAMTVDENQKIAEQITEKLQSLLSTAFGRGSIKLEDVRMSNPVTLKGNQIVTRTTIGFISKSPFFSNVNDIDVMSTLYANALDEL